MTRYEDFVAELERRKRSRWARILASEPAGRAAGRRPRDPAQERLLLRLDRARLARRDAAADMAVRRTATVSVGEPDAPGDVDDPVPGDDP